MKGPAPLRGLSPLFLSLPLNHTDTPPVSICEAAPVPYVSSWRTEPTSQSITEDELGLQGRRPSCRPPPQLQPMPKREGFKKVCRTEEESPCPFPGLPSGVLEMRVKEGSKIRNLMGFAMARMQGEKAGSGEGASSAGLRQVVFTGSGRAVTKTITCAEIMKRKVGCLHQLTKLQYKVVKEVWESDQGGASEMTVHRTVPSISILLSKDPLDPREPGYQPPEALSALWEDKDGAEPAAPTCKRPHVAASHSSFLQPKRLCLGEGVSVLPPH
uniref:Ribonuclease P and MRP subunit p25 n=1 Tax=Nothobranchius furzeri TaxID=105023 RepID=A0A8C6LLW4_NOTFU